VFVFALPALMAGDRHRRLGFILAAVLVVADVAYGYVCLRMPAPGPHASLAVRVVQPSIDQSEKWDHAVRERIFGHLIDLTRAPPAKGAPPPALIVWPETSVPFLFTERPDALAAIGQALGDKQTLLAGAVRTEGASGAVRRYYNSVVAIDGAGEIVDAVDKVHLVPFGEYLPFGDLLRGWGLDKLVDLPGPFSAGADRHVMHVGDGVKALAFVCYEIIFPGAGKNLAAGANIIVNVTNDAWFGNTPGPYQHLRQAQVHAVELGLPMVRAANNGISALVDAHGRILDALAMNAVGVLDADLALERANNPTFGTPFVNGIFIMFFIGCVALAMIVNGRRRFN
jgi:apolipoprotein N-acyltransferase